MPLEDSSDVKFEIGHVLFIDIVGYSKLLIHQQSELQRQANEIVRGTDQFRAAKKAGKLIRLPRGDGLALVFLNTVEAPVRCALEVSKTLLEHPELKVRMGVHSGPINRVRDVDDRPDVAGAGINMAQRVMDCGDAGHILLLSAGEFSAHWPSCPGQYGSRGQNRRTVSSRRRDGCQSNRERRLGWFPVYRNLCMGGHANGRT